MGEAGTARKFLAPAKRRLHPPFTGADGRPGKHPEAARMHLAALLFPLFATAAQGQATPESPVIVTGHAWAPFISPMGEPFRARTAGDDTLVRWFEQADRNRDGMVDTDEMQADAERFFATLDTNHDGEIEPEELVHYEWEVAPEIQVMSRTRRQPGATPGRQHAGGLQGAARYGLLNMPEPVAAADTNFDRGISLGEFRQAAVARFQLLDSGRQGNLGLAQLQAIRSAALAGRRSRRAEDARDSRIGNPLPPGD
jgi:hypothetical protein